ncbi:MAG TPA: carboxypeptidase regulatory-like domain-containing protein [Vicinamibacterales bacterium]|jgi:hypothetical protein|nr:carboxypeptidase regulatory-like domain-containing protein [Vicinamibacterales bacterium]
MKLGSILVSAVVIMISAVSRADGCSCMVPGPPCEAFWNHAAVFVGRVQSIDPYDGNRSVSWIGNRRVRFEVIDAFRGVTTGVVDVVTGSGGGDCGYAFEVGRTYLIYGYQPKGIDILTTSICSRTRPIRRAEEDLAYARAVTSDPASGGVIRGEVRHRDRTIDDPDSPGSRRLAPVADVAVVVDCGGLTYRTTTDSRGRFEIAGLAVGTCKVRPELDDREYAAAPPEVTVRDLRACATTMVVIASDGRIRGRIVDADAAPVAGVTVDLVTTPVTPSFSPPPVAATTDEDGAFELTRVPPGRYIVGVNTRIDFERTRFGTPSYFPGVSTPADATVINVGEGERQQLPLFTLPRGIRFATVRGVVETENGQMAEGAKVYLMSGSSPDRIVAAPALTDEHGRFIIAVPAGERWSLIVEWPKPVPGDSYNRERGKSPVFAASDHPAELRITVHPIKP